MRAAAAMLPTCTLRSARATTTERRRTTDSPSIPSSRWHDGIIATPSRIGRLCHSPSSDSGLKSQNHVENADDFFADDDSDKEATTPKSAAVASAPIADPERERKLAEMKIARADLARLGYRAEDIAQILGGRWKAPSADTTSGTAPQVSGPVYEGFTLRSVAGKVLERLKGK